MLRELGQNIGIVWGGRTSMQAGGERAGRQVFLTVDDARAVAAEASMVEVVSPELARGGVRAKSGYNAASAQVTGIEPPYQKIRTIELEYGRQFTWTDESQVSRVAIVGYEMADQLFGKRRILGETLMLDGLPTWWSARCGRRSRTATTTAATTTRSSCRSPPCSGTCRARTRRPAALSDIVVAPKPWVVDDLPRVLNERTGRIEDIEWPLEQERA